MVSPANEGATWRAPFNPNMRDEHHEWGRAFAADQARSFDQYGWPYYTREWTEEWFPGYGSSWPLYTGLLGILYEQAGADGSPVKQRDGTVLTYREDHQLVDQHGVADVIKHAFERSAHTR